MHLLKNFTDYYDHCVGYYGYDKTIVYDRRSGKPKLHFPSSNDIANKYLFAICGTYFPVVQKNGKFYFEEHEDLGKGSRYSFYSFENDFIRRYRGKPAPQNKEHRQPVILVSGSCIFSKDEVYIPRLAEFGFPSVISAEDMYQHVYAFLGWLKDNPEIPNTQTNKEKTISHGFCPKTSFRPNIKK